MTPRFLKFSIGLVILSFLDNIVLPLVLILTRNWLSDWSWVPFFGNILLLFCFVYVTFRFYYFKKVRFLFFLELIQLSFGLIAHYASFLERTGGEFVLDTFLISSTIYGMGIIIAVATLLSPLGGERLFLVLSIGSILILTSQLTGLFLDLLPLMAILDFISALFQLIWIPIFYRELNLTRSDELVDQ